ncbi:MAG: hypothetical protein R3F19_15725 [Verrucomicrobiales bacterium]
MKFRFESATISLATSRLSSLGRAPGRGVYASGIEPGRRYRRLVRDSGKSIRPSGGEAVDYNQIYLANDEDFLYVRFTTPCPGKSVFHFQHPPVHQLRFKQCHRLSSAGSHVRLGDDDRIGQWL